MDGGTRLAVHVRFQSAEHFRVTVGFAGEGGKTRLTMRMIFPNAEVREETVAFGAVDLGYQTLGRLADDLARRWFHPAAPTRARVGVLSVPAATRGRRRDAGPARGHPARYIGASTTRQRHAPRQRRS